MTLSRNGFQTFVNQQPAPGVIGDFASMNPRAIALAGPGAFRADSATHPVVIGYFAWGVVATGIATGVLTANSELGFVANELQSVITTFLADSRLSVQAGFPVTLYTHGDFWTEVTGGAVTVGATIYADATTGQPTVTDNSGANPDTGFKAATARPADSAITAALAATGILTVSAVGSGVVLINGLLSGTNVPANTFIQSQLSGSAGAAGTYQTNTLGVVVSSESMTVSQGQLVKITRTY
jgi:hypothetical protein